MSFKSVMFSCWDMFVVFPSRVTDLAIKTFVVILILQHISPVLVEKSLWTRFWVNYSFFMWIVMAGFDYLKKVYMDGK